MTSIVIRTCNILYYHRQTGRQAGRQAGRQTDRQTDRQTGRHGDNYRHIGHVKVLIKNKTNLFEMYSRIQLETFYAIFGDISAAINMPFSLCLKDISNLNIIVSIPN